MNNILRTTLVFAFIVCLSSIYVSNVLLACGGTCGKERQSGKESGVYPDQSKVEVKSEKTDVVKDPVCGMEVNDLKEPLSAEYKGNDYYFCSEYCKNTFEKEPASYAHKIAQQHGDGGEHNH